MKKMNKKGFTLVELLAVIVILALIMAIAVVSMSGIMTGARQSTFKETGLQIINGVRNQLTLANELVPSAIGTTGKKYYVSSDLLEKGGKTAPMGGEYYFYSPGNDEKPIGNSKGVYAMSTNVECEGKNASYVQVSHDGSNWVWKVCLTTKDGETYKSYIKDASETELLGSAVDMIKDPPAA